MQYRALRTQAGTAVRWRSTSPKPATMGNLKHAQRSCSLAHVLVRPVAKQCLTLVEHGSRGADSPLVRRPTDTQHYALLDSDLTPIACPLSIMI